MRKLLSLMALVAISSTTVSSVVACSQPVLKTPEDLVNGKAFDVKLGSFTSADGEKYKNGGADQWGVNSAGALYATLWSINNKPAQKHDDSSQDYAFQNQDVAAYLTKGESYVRGVDDGQNIFVKRGDVTKTEAELVANKGDDWHKNVVQIGDSIEIKALVNSYKKDADGKTIVDKEYKTDIVLNIIK